MEKLLLQRKGDSVMDCKLSRKERALKIGNLILENKYTIRQVAKVVGCSKMTAFNDVRIKLKDIDFNLYQKVGNIIDYNKSVRHLRGGEATKIKYSKPN